MLQELRNWVRKSSIMRAIVANYIVPLGFFDSIIASTKLSSEWEERISTAVGCPDNDRIERVANAGQIVRGTQIMHNGIRVNLGSYYGPEIAQLLLRNKGVHEPQEELVFGEVLKSLPSDATMIELGAFWSFYSMWFNKEIAGAKNYMVEPSEYNLRCGKLNFKLNNMSGNFTHAFVGEHDNNEGDVATICVDGFCARNDIQFIDVLHSDIQGFEHDMLLGAKQMIGDGKVGYCFISTHSDEVHEQCLQTLQKYGFEIVVEHDLAESFAADGLIVAKWPTYQGTTDIEIALRSR